MTNSPMPDEDPRPQSVLAARLRSVRAERDWTQEQAAVRAKTTARTLGKWEAAETEPSATHLVNLSSAYGVSVDFLLGRTDTRHGLIPGAYVIDLDAEVEAVANPTKAVRLAWRVPLRCEVVDEETAKKRQAEVDAKRRRKPR